MSWQQWIQAVEIPAILFLAGLMVKNRRDLQAQAETMRAELQRFIAGVQQNLHVFEVKVAENYATATYLKDVETRLVRSLARLEEKIDRIIDGGARHD